MTEQQPVLPGTETIHQPRKRKGGRPRQPEAIALTEVLAFRVTKAERARLKAEADAAGIAVGEYLRQRSLADAS
ncbi:plasmid mobilization protein [Modestobacter sp. KNN46-3]|uniref:plasmid mobilization protein n=1 Tax=Modestobacter sp. KNN46-3 TaxID=2711218 RepID=UPI0013E044E6|nr:hypothetical protein [Modestobacter sp. KNN46-3]